MFHTTAQVLINRNVFLIKQCIALRNEGLKTREATKQVAQDYPHEKISAGLVNSLMYDTKYPYAKQAWEIVKAEQKGLQTTSTKNLLPAQGHKTQNLQA